MKVSTATEHAHIVIIGAGISGVGAACYITEAFPGKKVIILEARGSVGGTWDLFRYPGIRSDSDLHTFAYEFKPWLHETAISEGHMIQDYMRETVEERGIGSLIRFRHEATSADWSSADAEWTLSVRKTLEDGSTEDIRIKAGWVFSATGYYRYDQGYAPTFAGSDDFEGDIIHPQHWPENYDHSDKKVVVIGSGATAITLIPAMATGPQAAAHVTMLQRTPSYILTLPRVDTLNLRLTRMFGEKRGYALTRFKNVWIDWAVVNFLSHFPKQGRKLVRYLTSKELPAGYDVDTHFNPPYEPWDQRLCLAPDGDFFKTIRDGDASVVTDRIERFTKNGILLESGRELDADVIVTATGLNMRFIGGIKQTVDGKPVDPSKTVTYRSSLLSGVPNWAFAMGYTKSSWTLKIGLLMKYYCSLLEYMDERGYDSVVPVADGSMTTQSMFDLSAGYMQRGEDQFPRQGTEAPWQLKTIYRNDQKLYKGPLIDGNLRFGTSGGHEVTPQPEQSAGPRQNPVELLAAVTGKVISR
ncbi:NAD(P)/FAD-dependent oxidoreductase [Rhodococcus pseudokoreensis]|uniref:NAD(P)/FAD-dependent oxidoreductase n=1 Tax=Rhodococcus pseudokoreensis TaxID=2811421 RepID=A0A974W6I8_9NOCA|nr:NAD(P)/FAD-dependent oxidoreductase [Rhodococcus pseudokoreensis]QSE91522.1 NAD(P)/FAD-dependent oxidoreductase [Rhodococcus pseudokoreensis]